MVLSVRHSGVALIGLAALTLSPALARAQDVTGVWLTDDGEAAVEIQPCGDSRCGRIVWLKDPVDSHGQPLRDANNPNASERGRPICGVQILQGVKRQSNDSWDGGSVYDPDEGKTYTVMLKRDGEARLLVTGYIGMKAFGETVVWTRNDSQKRCTAETKPRATQ